MSLDRREFMAAMAAAPLAGSLEGEQTRRALAQGRPIPDYRVVTRFTREGEMGAPGLFPGRVVSVHSSKCIDEVTEQVDVPTVRQMIAQGMTTLTGDTDARDSWARFFNADDFVGVKINCSGAPGAMSMPDIVAEIVRNLMDVGVKPTRIVIQKRGGGQILLAKYDQFVPAGVRVESSGSWLGYVSTR